jgi:hypothetical protein
VFDRLAVAIAHGDPRATEDAIGLRVTGHELYVSAS